MKTNTKRISLLVIGAALCAFLFVPSAGQAQDKTDAQTAERLQTKVSVISGSAKLPDVLAALSQQTGLTIQAEPYLMERKVFIQLENISARAALDALAALHDWKWLDMGKDRLLIMRRRIRLPDNAAALPRRIQASIPKDLRTFMAIPFPSDDMQKYASPLFTFDQLDIKDGTTNRIFAVVGQAQNLLAASLLSDNINGEPLRWKTLTEEQKEYLLTRLMFDSLWRTPYAMLHSDLMPYVTHPASASLDFEAGTTLHVRTIVNDGKTTIKSGFGTQITLAQQKESKP